MHSRKWSHLYMVWFYNVKCYIFFVFYWLCYNPKEKDHIWRKLKSKKKNIYMWNQYHYFDLSKIQSVRPVQQKISCLNHTFFLISKGSVLALFSLIERSLIWHCQLRFASILTPWYFTLSVGCSLLPHSLNFKFILLRFKDHQFSCF